MSALILAAILAPLLLAILLASRAIRPAALHLAPWSPLPAMLLAATAPDGVRLEIPWLLLGSVFAVDDIGRPFLFVTAWVWLVAGLYAAGYLRDDPRRTVFFAFFLLTQAGNLALCVAHDAASFYLGFAVMSFAAYGLVVHAATPEARRAGRIYLAMAVLGEALLVAGLLLLAAAAGDHRLAAIAARFGTLAGQEGIAALLLAGFGIKVGVPLLHLWLPLAHPVAPVPASAVLSGVILKAGLLGWLRFLPLGAAELPALGATTLAAGLVAMFYGVALGLTQRDPKTVLAYSSISQMGFMTAGVGAGLLVPASWPLLLPAVGLYALHHALAKSALFLGVGVARAHGGTRAVLLGMALPALALAGAPWSTGAFSKTALKSALVGLPEAWHVAIAVALPLGALATSLLMAHLLLLVAREPRHGAARGLLLPWLLSLAAQLALAAWMARLGIAGATLADAVWPIAAAAMVTAAAARRGWPLPSLPPGDLVVIVDRVAGAVRRAVQAGPPEARLRLPRPDPARWLRTEAALGRWTLAASLWLALLAALAAALLP